MSRLARRPRRGNCNVARGMNFRAVTRNYRGASNATR